MEENQFLEDFSTIFDDVELEELSLDTQYKNFDEWSSLTALSLLAVIEEEYEVSLTHNDVKNSVTIGDIYAIVKNQSN